jgi:prefoldin subunit 5
MARVDDRLAELQEQIRVFRERAEELYARLQELETRGITEITALRRALHDSAQRR